MLNKDLFKSEMLKAYMITGEEIPKTEVNKFMYEECIYLTDEEFKIGIKNMLNNCTKVNLPNLFHNLPSYKTYEDGKRIEPPKSIEDYCKKYLYKSYAEDKHREYLNTLTEKETKVYNEIKQKFNIEYEVKKEYLNELSKMNIDTLVKEYKESYYYLHIGKFLEYKITGKKPYID